MSIDLDFRRFTGRRNLEYLGLEYSLLDSYPSLEAFTKDYSDFFEEIKQEWESNKQNVEEFLEALMRTPVSGKARIIIFPRGAGQGHSPQKDVICWGVDAKGKCKNYYTIYLAHEYLHVFFRREGVENNGYSSDKKRFKEDVSHTVNGFITDDELRMHLNGEGEYFERWENRKRKGYHDYLLEFQKSLEPEWREYLESRQKALNLIRELRRRQSVKKKWKRKMWPYRKWILEK